MYSYNSFTLRCKSKLYLKIKRHFECSWISRATFCLREKQTTSRCVLQEKMEMYDLGIAFLPVKNRPSVVIFDKNSTKTRLRWTLRKYKNSIYQYNLSKIIVFLFLDNTAIKKHLTDHI